MVITVNASVVNVSMFVSRSVTSSSYFVGSFVCVCFFLVQWKSVCSIHSLMFAMNKFKWMSLTHICRRSNFQLFRLQFPFWGIFISLSLSFYPHFAIVNLTFSACSKEVIYRHRKRFWKGKKQRIPEQNIFMTNSFATNQLEFHSNRLLSTFEWNWWTKKMHLFYAIN